MAHAGKTAFRWIVAIVLTLVLIAVLAFVAFSRGLLGVDDWVVRQIVGVVETYIHPTIEFDEFSYEAPYTVTLTGVTLRSDDDVRIVEMPQVVIQLASRPKRGQPLQIEGVTLEEPNVRLVAYEQDDGSTGFRGLVPFVKQDALENQADQPDDRKLNEVFELRSLALMGGKVTYIDVNGETLTFRGIEFQTDITETTGPEGQTLHEFDVSFGNAPLLQVIADGKLDLNELEVYLDAFRMNADLTSPAAREALPQRVRQLLGEAEATGTLEATALGRVNLQNPAESDATATLLINDAKFATGDIQAPVELVDLEAEISGGYVRLDHADIDTLDGRINLTDGRLDLRADHLPLTLVWNIQGVNLNRLVREVAASDDKPDLYGLVDSTGAIRTELDTFQETLDGVGTLVVSEAQLTAIPILSDLFNAADILGALQGQSSRDDRLEAEFRIRPESVVVDELMISVPAAKFSGTGVAEFSGGLDFQLRGGAVEKVPLIGEALGNLTGKLVRYDVTGTVSDPKVAVQPLGLGGGGERDVDEGADPTQTSGDTDAREEARETEEVDSVQDLDPKDAVSG